MAVDNNYKISMIFQNTIILAGEIPIFVGENPSLGGFSYVFSNTSSLQGGDVNKLWSFPDS